MARRLLDYDPATGLVDYDAVRAEAREFKPLVLVAGYSAYRAASTSPPCARSPTRSAPR